MKMVVPTPDVVNEMGEQAEVCSQQMHRGTAPHVPAEVRKLSSQPCSLEALKP
jgi:hypothetical protein